MINLSMLVSANNYLSSVQTRLRQTATIDCSAGYCFDGFWYQQNGPFLQMDANINMQYPPSQSLPSGSYTDFWIGLQQCSPTSSCSPPNNVLVQAGTNFGDDNKAWNQPTVFVEIIGKTSWNGLNCETQFCGYFLNVHASDTISLSAYLQGGSWYAVAQDTSHSAKITISISASNLGNPSLGYAISTFEGNTLTSQHQMPRFSPVNIWDIVLYNSNGQISINPSQWQNSNTPISSSGITITDSLNGGGETTWTYST